MEDTLLEIKSDIKEIKSDVKTISQILDKNTASLIIHEARTTLAEKRIERFENGARWILGLIATSVLSVLIKLLVR
jgi:hypothetical protein